MEAEHLVSTQQETSKNSPKEDLEKIVHKFDKEVFEKVSRSLKYDSIFFCPQTYVTGFAKTGLIAGVRNYSYSPFSSAK